MLMWCALQYFAGISAAASAQTPVSLETAYQKLLQQNLDLKTGQLKADYQNQLMRSYRMIDAMNISAEAGQINSAYFDNRFSVNQSIRLPKYYQAQKKVLEAEWNNAVLQADFQKWQILQEVAMLYNQLSYLDEKEKLLQKTDSIYSNYYSRAVLRLKAGESNILEKTTAENYRSQAEMALRSLRKEREIALAQFNFLINGSEIYINEPGRFFSMNLDSAVAPGENSSWFMRQADQQRTTESARLEAEKAKLLPVLSAGINTTTMRGMGADDRYYNGSHRFFSGQIGVAVPVFNGAQKSVIEAQKINQQIAENNYELTKRQLQRQYAQKMGEYDRLKSEMDYYRTTGLKNAEKILFTASLLLREGEMNYLEYSLLINQSFEIKNKYLETQKQLNDKIIELNFLQNPTSTLKL